MIDSLVKKAIQMKIDEKNLDWIKVRSACLFSKENRLVIELDLEGESEAVKVGATYSILGDKIVIESIKTSRKWMTEVADLVLVKTGKSFKLPGGMKGVLVKALL